MQVLHSLWDRKTFFIWAESSSLPLNPTSAGRSDNRTGKPSSPHSFALPGLELKALLQETFPNQSNDDRIGRVEPLAIRLPSGKKGPLPSPGLLREDFVSERPTHLVDCTVQALAYEPSYATDLLLEMPIHPRQGTVFADSMLFWSQLALFALELVAREQFVPAVREANALWKPVIDEQDMERLGIFFECMPPSCRGLLPQSGPELSPQNLVTSFLDSAVNALVHASLLGVTLLPKTRRRGRPPKAVPLAQQFLEALSSEVTSNEPGLKASSEELASFSREMESWTSQILPELADVPFRTCFRLEAPAKDSKTWGLSFFLQAKDDRSLLVPADDVWRTKSSALTFLKKRLKNPQEQLLGDLGKATRVFPLLEKSLESARPTSLEMETEEAYSYLRQSAPLLEQNGFGVLLPSWWERPGSKLGVKIRLLDAPKKVGKVGPAFFGLNSLVEYDWQLSLGDNPLSEAEFAELARLKVPLVQVRGEWMELRQGEIEAAIEFFQKNKDGEMTLAEALRLGLNPIDQKLSKVKSPLPILGLQAEGAIEQILSALSDPSGRLEPITPPAGFRGTLRPYQLRGVSWLSYLHGLGLGACLADDMGLGKTVELIAFLLLLRERDSESESEANGPKPALLICPMSVAGNWQKELERFAPHLRVLVHHGPDRLCGQAFLREVEKKDVVITTYALAQRDEEDLSSIFWSHLILDEAQSIKNQAAQQTQSIKRLRGEQRIALTGTPVENRLSELWSLMDFLNPGYLGSAQSFRKDFVLPIEKFKNKSSSVALRSIIQPFVLRRLKTDQAVITDLPDKIEMKVNYNLTAEQASLYAAVVEEMLVRIESMTGIERKGQILAALTKLKQICNHPALFLQDGSPLDGRSGKLSRLEDMISEAIAEGDRALIFTQFAGMGAMLKHHLQEKLGVEILFLHGKTSKKQRDDMVQRFQAGESPIFVLSLKAGGFGLNLTAASHVFHFDRWWNPAVENQATDRAFRIGQKKNVFVHKFVCLGTLEEQIDRMIEQKKTLAESVIGTGENWLTELSNEALRDMLSLRRDSIGMGGE